jgi:alpha-ribazole phosphatase
MPRELLTTLDLMRHGEPVGGRRYRGQTDDPLSEKGWAQMRKAVGHHCPWQSVISSSLSRCAEFARELAMRHQLPLEIDARLVVLGFGAWEGRTPEELVAVDPEALNRFRLDPVVHAPPGAEPLTAFRDRIISAWDSLLMHHGGKHVLVVVHAGVIRMVVAHVLNVPLRHLFRLQVPNAGITRIRVEEHGGQQFPQLLFHGGNL